MGLVPFGRLRLKLYNTCRFVGIIALGREKENSEQNCYSKMLAHETLVPRQTLELIPFDICPNLHKLYKAYKLIKSSCEQPVENIHFFVFKCGPKLCALPGASAFNWGLPNIFSIYGSHSKSFAALNPLQSSLSLPHCSHVELTKSKTKTTKGNHVFLLCVRLLALDRSY